MSKKNKRIILYYTLEFFLSIVLISTVLLILCQSSLLNQQYIAKKLKDNNYYEEVEKEIIDKQKNYIIQSGFPESVLDNIIDSKELKQDIDSVLDCLYKRKEISYHTDNVETRLRDNIKAYLDKTNAQVADDNALDLFTEEIVKVYKTEISSIIPMEKVGNVIFKIRRTILLTITVCVVIILAIFFTIKFYLKKVALPIPFITTSLLLMFLYIYIKNHIDIVNLFIFNKHFSDVLQGVVNQILSDMVVIAIVFFIIGILLNIIFKKTKSINKKA